MNICNTSPICQQEDGNFCFAFNLCQLEATFLEVLSILFTTCKSQDKAKGKREFLKRTYPN